MVAAAPAKSPATDYARRVRAGDIVAGPLVRLACERHLRDLEREGEPGFPYRFDAAREAKFLLFAQHMNLSEGVPFVLEPFQQFIVGALFGWVDEHGFRRFRTGYIEMGKGNGKTPLAALVGLYMLRGDGEWQAEVYTAAVTRDQANIMFTDAKNIAKATPALSRSLEVLGHNIAYGDSFFRTVSAEARSLDGKRPHASLIDEIHEHPTPIVVQKQRAGMKRRMQPLVFEITNSGYDRNSICWEHHEHSRQVLEGTLVDETWFAYVCGLDEGDDWHDEAVWPKANPGLGSILPVTYIREQVKEADAMPSSQNLILRLNFCVWTQQSTKWIDLSDWDACEDEVDLEALRGERCFAGLDLASTTDLAAFVLWFPDHDTVLPFFFAPEEASSRRWERDRVPYPEWMRDGFIEQTEGNITDYDYIRERIRELAGIYDIAEIGYDRWNATQLVTQLVEDGAQMVPVGQGFASMSAPAKAMEALIIGRRLRHDGNPVLRWMAGNVSARQDPAGNIKPDREKSADKIDGIVALVMALSRAVVDQGESRGSVYEDPEALLFR